jgi:2-desacetyl-2-hydroxyethyl bacteriochlorophyllide A dehydrogenase
MKTLTCTQPHHFEYSQTEIPVLQSGYAIIKIARIGICGTDLHAYEGTQPYFTYPRILGHELSGTIHQIQADQSFAIGDKVTFIPYFNCNQCIACKNNKPNCCTNIQVCGVHIDGGMREYLQVPISTLIKQNDLSFDELALVEPLAIGAHAIRRANVQPNEYVLVIGAGPIGIGIMEFAKIAGANVIALDVNAQRLSFCKETINLPHCINATDANVYEQIQTITNSDMPTVVIDATGNLKAINNALQYLAHGGRYVLVGLQKENFSFSHPEFHKRETTLLSSRNATRDDFNHVLTCMKNKLINPTNYITHKVAFDNVANEFDNFLNPANGVIKAMIEVE